MRLSERLSLWMKADAHGVLDQIEERPLLIRQHLREAETELARKRAEVEALQAEETRSREEVARLRAAMESLDEDVNLALANDKEELARFALRKWLPLARAAEAAERRGQERATTRQRLAERLEVQEDAFRVLKERARAELAACEAPPAEELAPAPAVREEEVDLELLRRRTGGAESAR